MSKRPDKSKAAKEPRRKMLGVSLEAVEEIKMIYDAWLGYLLARQGEETLRVKAEDIRGALENFSCSVERDGDAYVIRLQTGKEESNG